MTTKTNTKTVKFKHKLSATPEQTVKVFPRKSVFVEKYNEYITFDDNFFDKMIESFNNPKLFKPYIDKEHELGIKYADITALFKKPDGLYATVELNELGLKAIKNNEYSYISPEWGARIDTEEIEHPVVLWAITLTNIPALEGELPRLQEQIKLERERKMSMSEKTLRLTARLEAFKLQGEADPAMMIKVIEETIAAIGEIQMKLTEAIGQRDQAIEESNAVSQQYESLHAEINSKNKEAFFEEVVKSGQVEMAELEAWKNQYETSKDFVTKILTSRPKKQNAQLSATMANLDQTGLTEEDYFIMAQEGYDKTDPKDVNRYKKLVLGMK
jgi:hypothetical protein